MAITKDSENLYSSMRFVGDGVTKRVPLTFDLREGDGLAVDFGEGLVTSGYLIDYDVTPVVVLFSEPLPKGKTITIRRLTKIDAVKHIFQWTGNAQGGADFSAKNVDENFEQITRASQDAMDSQTLATETLEEMAGIRDDAIDARDKAKVSEANAKQSEVNSKDSELEARISETNAKTSETKAKDSEIKAKAWATNPVDLEVETGEYSAYHWASKAKEIVGFDPDDYRKKDDLSYEDGRLLTNKEIINVWDQASDENVFSAGFVKVGLGYATPEMFGAVGDGVVDDTTAYLQALQSKLPIVHMNIYNINPEGMEFDTPLIGNGGIKFGNSVINLSSTFKQENRILVTSDEELEQVIKLISNTNANKAKWVVHMSSGVYSTPIILGRSLAVKESISFTGDLGEDTLILFKNSVTSLDSLTFNGEQVVVVESISSTKGLKLGNVIGAVVKSVDLELGSTVLVDGVANSIRALGKVPTTIIKGVDRGLVVGSNINFSLDNIMFDDCLVGETVSRGAIYHRGNVFNKGSKTGLNINSDVFYYPRGGFIYNATDLGVQELFGVTRSYTKDNSLTLFNCLTALNFKENCSGHLDDVFVTSCDSALVMHAYSTANTRKARFQNCITAVTLVNSEIHADSSIEWGVGVDANKSNIVKLGCSSAISKEGWVSSSGEITTRTGYTNVRLVKADYTQQQVKANDFVVNELQLIESRTLGLKSQRFKIVLYCFAGVANSDTTFTLRLNSLAGQVKPANAVGGFKVEFEVISTSDDNSQLVVSNCSDGTGAVQRRTLYLTGDSGTSVTVQVTGSPQSLVVHGYEIFM